MTVPMVILGRKGLVHRGDGQACTPAHVAAVRKPVTSNQVLVYKLPGCPTCWDTVTYRKQMERSR